MSEPISLSEALMEMTASAWVVVAHDSDHHVQILGYRSDRNGILPFSSRASARLAVRKLEKRLADAGRTDVGCFAAPLGNVAAPLVPHEEDEA